MRKRPRDPAQLAKMIVDIASGEVRLWEIGDVVKMLEDWEGSQKEAA
jgi:hypothetical protein